MTDTPEMVERVARAMWAERVRHAREGPLMTILPCPFCGSSDVSPSSWDVKCSGCGAEMPGDTPRAIAAWNRRAPDVRPDDDITVRDPYQPQRR